MDELVRSGGSSRPVNSGVGLLTIEKVNSMKHLFIAFVMLTVLFANSTQSQERDIRISKSFSGQRVALVIGNGAYEIAPLKNPVNDAREMARALRELGFKVTLKENLNQYDMKKAIEAFGEELRSSDIGLFYYAGHGFQAKGRNYLKPVGSIIKKETEVKYKSVDVGLVLTQMGKARNKINIVILDACRNNPYAYVFRSEDVGLASIDAPSDTLIAYATAPGKVALDGDTDNSVYTKELLRYIGKKDLSIEEVFKRVRADVRDKTGGWQIPWESSSLTYDVYLNQEFTLNGGILNGKAIKKPAPSYPAAAKAAGVWGEVNVQITIDEMGRVISAKAYGYSELLREAAEKAAYQALFSPTLMNGKPVKVTGYLIYNFVLNEK